MFTVAVRHQGGDGAKGFGGVNGRSFVRLRAEQQGGREECASRLQIGFTTQTDLAARGKQMIDFLEERPEKTPTAEAAKSEEKSE